MFVPNLPSRAKLRIVTAMLGTLPQINMEVERGSKKTTILHIGPSMGFHVNLEECRCSALVILGSSRFEMVLNAAIIEYVDLWSA